MPVEYKVSSILDALATVMTKGFVKHKEIMLRMERVLSEYCQKKLS
jgi:hypothetical protein